MKEGDWLMLNLKPLVHRILEDYSLPRDGTHGVSHWARVLENGLRLAKITGANPEVVQLFALFHDSRRVNELTDSGHGQRGADLATQLRGQWFDLSDADFQTLYFACAHHTEGKTEGEITIQTCWDADRLDLGRVGTMLERTRLCTQAAKSQEIMSWADDRASIEMIPDLVAREWGIHLKGGH